MNNYIFLLLSLISVNPKGNYMQEFSYFFNISYGLPHLVYNVLMLVLF